MKFFKRSLRPTPALFALAAVCLTSCNRGYGCPTNFSLADVLDAVSALVIPFA